MLLTLLESSRPRLLMGQGAMASIVLHAALVGVVAYASRPAAVEEAEGIDDERVTFIMPLDRIPRSRPQQEQVQWLADGEGGGNEGTEQREIDRESDIEAMVAGRGEEEGGESVMVPPTLDSFADDTVLTILEVDSAVTRSPESAAPSYPETLLSQNVEGVVNLQYVVDTLGLIDTATVKVLDSSHPEFERAVREALPGMRFTPAIVRSRKVRQLVQQPFTFKITRPAETQALNTAVKKPL